MKNTIQCFLLASSILFSGLVANASDYQLKQVWKIQTHDQANETVKPVPLPGNLLLLTVGNYNSWIVDSKGRIKSEGYNDILLNYQLDGRIGWFSPYQFGEFGYINTTKTLTEFPIGWGSAPKGDTVRLLDGPSIGHDVQTSLDREGKVRFFDTCSDGSLYVTSYSENKKTMVLSKLTSDRKEIAWQKSLPNAAEMEVFADCNIYVLQSRSYYTGEGEDKLSILDAAGNTVWEKSLASTKEKDFNLTHAQLVDKKTLAFQLNVSDRKPDSKTNSEMYFISSTGAELLHQSSARGLLVWVDPATGLARKYALTDAPMTAEEALSPETRSKMVLLDFNGKKVTDWNSTISFSGLEKNGNDWVSTAMREDGTTAIVILDENFQVKKTVPFDCGKLVGPEKPTALGNSAGEFKVLKNNLVLASCYYSDSDDNQNTVRLIDLDTGKNFDEIPVAASLFHKPVVMEDGTIVTTLSDQGGDVPTPAEYVFWTVEELATEPAVVPVSE